VTEPEVCSMSKIPSLNIFDMENKVLEDVVCFR